MTLAEAIAIAILQGITELFPISSLGHAVVLPALFAPSIDLRSQAFLPFLVVLHLGTAIALLLISGETGGSCLSVFSRRRGFAGRGTAAAFSR